MSFVGVVESWSKTRQPALIFLTS